jgi:arylsulfatase A-like enzyme
MRVDRDREDNAGRASGPGARLLACLVAALAVAAALHSGGGMASAQAERPNFLVIQTDDQSLRQLYSTWLTARGRKARTMPRTLDQIGRQGISFNRYYVTYPLCCPSRATLLSGRYAHGHRVLSNEAPRGGYDNGFRPNPIYRQNLAPWLQDLGYRTVHIGKFMNNYGGKDEPAETDVPPGWSVWETTATDNSTRLYYGYRLNVNGAIQGPFGDPGYADSGLRDHPSCRDLEQLFGVCNHQIDAVTRRAQEQLTENPGAPFFMLVDYIAPHGDRGAPIGPEPAPRHYDSAIRTPLPKPPSFNERDISDKPSFIRDDAEGLDPRAVRRIRIEYQKGLESLRTVDEGVGRLLNVLRELGELENTYVFFTTDNGFFFGEHRLERAKFLPYEAATRAPLLVRGPGIRRSSRSGELVANIDIAPTILELAGARATRPIEGRSLVPFWTDTSLRTRRPILLQSFINATDVDGDGIPDGEPRGASISIQAPLENYLGVRVGPYKYVEYETGDRELYDLRWDPDELESMHANRTYNRVQRYLAGLIERLEACIGSECRFEADRLPQPQVIRRDPISPR